MDPDRLDHPLSDGVVTLRPPTRADRAALLSMRDDQFRRFLGEGSPEPAPTACIVDSSGVVVGWIDHDNDRTWLRFGEVNVGYAIDPQQRGKGYATRAVRLLAVHLAENVTPRIATLLIDPENVASVAVAERAGFVEERAVDGERFFVWQSAPHPPGLVPVIAVRVAEGRCGSTVLMLSWRRALASHQHVTSPSTAESIGRWRRDLTADDANTLARLIGNRVSQFGYEL